jgi:hypothetical protein
MPTRYIWRILLMVCLVYVPATAAIIPAPDIDKLTEASTLIVLGELVVVQQGVRTANIDVNGRTERLRVDRGTLRVDQFLRGAQPSPLTFEIVAHPEFGWRTPAQQTYGLFFFRLGRDGSVEFTDPFYLYIDVPKGVHGKGNTALERVINVLGEMLTLPNSHNLNQEALRYLQSSESNTAHSIFRSAMDTITKPELTVGIAAGLLRFNDASGLRIVKQLFLNTGALMIDSFDEAILGAAMGHLKDPEAIPDLELLQGVPSIAIRRGVAGALRGTRSSKALNGLARGLEDTDAKVRYLAVVGLAEITGDSAFRPSEARFKADEAHFLGHWRQWAQSRTKVAPTNR